MLLESSLVMDQGEDSDSNSDSRSKARSESAPESALTPEENLQICTLMEEINLLSQSLASKKIARSHYPVVIKAIQSAKYSLTLANASAEGMSALPLKELIVPNQNSWSETAMHMGVKWPLKQKCLPEEHGLTEWAIDITSRHHCTDNDPYSTGQCSGMWAKPDALSTNANGHARGIPPPATAPT